MNGVWITGQYDTKKEIFTSDIGDMYKFTATKLVDKMNKNEIEFIKEMA